MEPRIKILFTIPNFNTAGSQYVMLSLFRNIDKTVFEPYICVENFPEAIPKDISEENTFLFQWKENKWNNILRFKKLLKKNEIDILHSWDYKANYVEALACRLAGVSYLYTKKNNSWSKRWWLKSFFSSYIAYDNPEMKKRFFNAFIFQKKIIFIPHGVNTSIFKPLEKTFHTTFNIATIGNICENKNQLFIIKALKKLPENVELHLYGKEEKGYKKILIDEIVKLGFSNRVHFHGFVENEEIPNIFKKIDLFVLASHQEGLPVSIIEAMACGVPVLSSNAGGGVHYLLPSEVIFSLNNPSNLAAEILKIYNLTSKEKKELTQQGIEKIRRDHTIEKEILTYENVYKNLIKK